MISVVYIATVVILILPFPTHQTETELINQSGNTSGDNTTHNDTGPPHDEDNHEDGGHGKDGIILIPVHFSHVEYPLIFSLVVIFAGLSKLAFHYSHFLSSKVPESCVLIILGVIFGVVLHYSGVSKDVKLFAPHEFFLFLLPPIILESAFSLHDRTFAENIGGVLLFAVLGTVLNCFLIGLTMYGLYQAGAMEDVQTSLVQMLVFSALIVAVDPVAVLAVFQEVGVNNMLYFLVFGESLLNDGVTVVLYNVMQIFNTMPTVTIGQIFLGIAKFFIVVLFGLVLGILCGLISSFITKYTNSVKVVEPLIVFGFAYLSYIMSELFEFSGIVSIIACGIIQVHYAFHNITNKSRLAIKFFAKVMATASEIIIFLFLGIVTIDQSHDWKTGFTVWALVLCILYRFLVTYGLSVCINKFSTGRIRKIRPDEMFMISYGGLRGAVCFSLVALINEKEIPMKNMFVTTTLFVIFFTVFIQGGTIKWLVKKMRVKLAENSAEMKLNEEVSSHGGTIKWLVRKLRVKLAESAPDMKINEELSHHVFDHIMAGIEEIVGYTTGEHHIKEKLDHIDDTVIRPKILRNATKSELDDISHYYEKLVMKEHYKNLQLSGAKLPRVKTEIRHLDSELALDKLGHDEDEHEAHQRHDDLVTKREEEHMKENKTHGENIHKFFSNTMHTVRSRLHLKVHDKNLVHDNRHHLISHLRRKHRKNKVLRDMRTKVEEGEASPRLPPKSLSFNLDGTRAFEDRKPSQVKFTLAETVYEEDENGHANVALETNEDESSGTENGQVTFSL